LVEDGLGLVTFLLEALGVGLAEEVLLPRPIRLKMVFWLRRGLRGYFL
jgi:hypothetical protein